MVRVGKASCRWRKQHLTGRFGPALFPNFVLFHESQQPVAGSQVLARALEALEVAAEVLAGGGALVAAEVDVGDAGDGEAAGGELQLGGEGGALGGGGGAVGEVAV